MIKFKQKIKKKFVVWREPPLEWHPSDIPECHSDPFSSHY